MLELHMAHGYLLASLPLAAHQSAHATSTAAASQNRLRFPLEVLQRGARAHGRRDKPLSVRISATRLGRGRPERSGPARASRARSRHAGADLLDVSSGQTVPWQKPVYGRMWQTPFADQIRNDVGIATMAVGNIYEPDHVNSIIAAGRADLCAIARPHLANPAWTLRGGRAAGLSRAVVAGAVPLGQEPARAQPAARGAAAGAV